MGQQATSRTAGDAIATGIKPIYIAVNSAAAAELRDNLDAKWGGGYLRQFGCGATPGVNGSGFDAGTVH